jgi:hypothetical protein
MNTFRIVQDVAYISFSLDKSKREAWKTPHKSLWWELLNFLQNKRGFDVFKDERIEKHYKSLSNTHRQGKKADLEFKSDIYGNGFKIEFYQNIVFDNPHGGQYDFDKFNKMPYLIKKSFLNEIYHIKRFFTEHNVTDNSDGLLKTAEEKVLKHIREYRQFHHKDQFESLQESIGHSPNETYNHLDQDKKQLFNGQVKYFRDSKGYLQRGTVYHHINNMWWVITNRFDYRNLGSGQLFDCSPSQLNRKEHPRRSKKLETLKTEATKEENYEQAIVYRDILTREEKAITPAA